MYLCLCGPTLYVLLIVSSITTVFIAPTLLVFPLFQRISEEYRSIFQYIIVMHHDSAAAFYPLSISSYFRLYLHNQREYRILSLLLECHKNIHMLSKLTNFFISFFNSQE